MNIRKLYHIGTTESVADIYRRWAKGGMDWHDAEAAIRLSMVTRKCIGCSVDAKFDKKTLAPVCDECRGKR